MTADVWRIFLAVIAGWLTAGLLNYLADVLPTKRKLTQAACSQCGQQLPWQYYWRWQAKCASCGYSHGKRIWFVRISVIVMAAWLLIMPPLRFRMPLGQAFAFLLLFYLLLVIVIDMEHRLILHVTSLFGAVLGLLIGSWLHGFSSTILGGVAGFLLMWLVYLLGIGFVRLLGRIRQREIGEEAMGFGDVILGGVIGLYLGWPGVMAGLMLTFILGGVGSLLYLILAALAQKHTVNLTLPYGPFLAISVWILLFIR
jgi:leader peptidase (prepilin peptidase)/N-methyltransferase